MTRSNTYHHGNLKQALIQAGLDILGEKGLTGLTLRACATKAGASHTAPKNHFENLAGLQTAIAALGYQRLFDRMTSDLAPDMDGHDRRHHALDGYVAFATEEPGLFELMFSPHRTKSDDPDLLAQAAKCLAVLSEHSSGLVWRHSDQPDAALKAQVMHWALVHGFAQLKMSGKLDKGAMQGLTISDIFPNFDYETS